MHHNSTAFPVKLPVNYHHCSRLVIDLLQCIMAPNAFSTPNAPIKPTIYTNDKSFDQTPTYAMSLILQ
jgi:hypothetical protein